MAILKITNNLDTINIPGGALPIYESLGYHVVGEKAKKNKKSHDVDDVDVENQPTETSDSEEDAIFLDAVMQVPVDDWTKEDVKKFIQLKGIDASSAKKPHEYKALIKEYLGI